MTLRNQKSVIWAPAGLSDALDTSEEDFPGSLSLCSNLIPAQNNRKMMVARPAATFLTGLPDFGGGPVTCMAAVGNMIYGMYASAAFSGKDRPFGYNLTTGAFLTISGLSSGNLPTSQATTGDWTPPTAENVGTRVIFTHPGFPDGPSLPTQFTGFGADTTNGSPSLTGYPWGKPYSISTGMILSGPGIPAGTTIQTVTPSSIVVNASGTMGNTFITVASATGLAVGQPINLFTGQWDTIASIAGTQVNLSSVTLSATFTSQPTTFGSVVITMSQNATATANNVTVYATSPAGAKFGWLDFSSFSSSILGNTINGTAVIFGGFNVTGIEPGMSVTGPGIQAGTQVLGATPITFNLLGNLTVNTTNLTNISGTPTINQVFPLGAGQSIAGLGLQVGTTITSASAPFGVPIGNTSTSAVLSVPATASETQAQYTVSGSIIILTQPATATANQATFTVAGGTFANPLWGAGDTQVTQLPSIPVFVRQLAGSACFGCNTTNPPTAGVVFSDPGIPCQVSQASQAITFKNAVPVTAAAGLPLENQLGGIIQSLIVFQGGSNIQQITGSIALANITVNASQVATGTFAPNSVASTPKGLIFASPFGLRMIDFDGRVTDPIGARGKGAVIPFQNAVNATRSNGSFNENTYRITISWQPPPTLQNIWGSATRTDEFWLHLDLGTFTGPHTSVMDLSAPWISNETFVCAPSFGRGGLYVSDPDQAQNSAYAENGKQLTWTLRTTLLPDDESMLANSIVESDIFASMSAATQWLASFIDDQNATQAQAYVWLGPGVTQSKLPIFWNNAIVFRQGSVLITGNSEPQTLIGALGLRYQKLKYQLPFRPSQEFVVGQSPLGGPGVIGP